MKNQTIQDFGRQWTRYQDSSGYYGSPALFLDICGPLLSPEALAGSTVVEVGSGTGRIVEMLLDLGAAEVVAVEPSAAMRVLRANTASRSGRIRYEQVPGEQSPDVQSDLVFAIGVLHHIPDPGPTVRRAFQILKPGGRFLFWVYGKEGNETYIRFAEPLRRLTVRLPDRLLVVLCWLLSFFLALYIAACRILPLPLHRYMREVLGKFDAKSRRLTIFDQLNPAHQKYYEKAEAIALMELGGFRNIRVHNRHGYSWTVMGEKPSE